jgi:hypothetical protein
MQVLTSSLTVPSNRNLASSRSRASLPSIEEVCTQVADLDARLAHDPEAGREQLRRWLKDGAIRIGPTKTAIAAEGEILPLIVISDGGGRKGNYAKPIFNGFA